ncbi:hypothetical protein VTH82DRAFT_5177 [Thermothelomyces myriococcoides]
MDASAIADRETKLTIIAPDSGPGMKPEESVLKAMTFWNLIFPLAMEKFKNMTLLEAPKHLDPAYDIRNDRTWTEIADKATGPVEMVTRMVPPVPIATPVLTTVQILLDAVKKGAEVRNETLDRFGELEDVIFEVEQLLGIFHDEASVKEKAVNLVANILLAIERGIGLFTRPGLKRGVKAIINGQDYERPLLDSLTCVADWSKKLREEAQNTHMRHFRFYSRESLRDHELIREGQREIAIVAEKANTGVAQAVENTSKVMVTADVMNSKLDMLMDKHDQAMEKKIGYLNSLVNRIVCQPPWYPAPLLDALCIDQEGLWRLMDITDLDTADMEEIEEKAYQLPLQYRVRAEQMVNNQAFQEWIVSPSSAKLLIYANFPGLVMETSALSLFCTTLIKAFRSRKRYLCLVWFCGRHLGYDDESDLDLSDSEAASDDDDDPGWVHYGEDDYMPGTRQRVIKRMMRSLIAQLLCDYEFDQRYLLPPSADLHALEDHSLPQLWHLFGWLVRQMPEGVTLFCLVDGIVFYEREDFEEPMLDVLGDLIGLTASRDISAAVKVLVTSPRPPFSTIRAGFEDEIVKPDGSRETKNRYCAWIR